MWVPGALVSRKVFLSQDSLTQPLKAGTAFPCACQPQPRVGRGRDAGSCWERVAVAVLSPLRLKLSHPAALQGEVLLLTEAVARIPSNEDHPLSPPAPPPLQQGFARMVEVGGSCSNSGCHRSFQTSEGTSGSGIFLWPLPLTRV